MSPSEEAIAETAELVGQFGSSLLQLFYCISDDCEDGGEAFSDTKLVRLVQPNAPAHALLPDSYAAFPAKTLCLPGDGVQIRNRRTLINDRAIAEPYVKGKSIYNYEPVTVSLH